MNDLVVGTALCRAVRQNFYNAQGDLDEAGIAAALGDLEQYYVARNKRFSPSAAERLVYRKQIQTLLRRVVDAASAGNPHQATELGQKVLQALEKHPGVMSKGGKINDTVVDEAEMTRLALPRILADGYQEFANQAADALIKAVKTQAVVNKDLMITIEDAIDNANRFGLQLNVPKKLYRAATVVLVNALNGLQITEAYIDQFPGVIKRLNTYIEKADFSAEEREKTIQPTKKKILDKFDEILFRTLHNAAEEGDELLYDRAERQYRTALTAAGQEVGETAQDIEETIDTARGKLYLNTVRRSATDPQALERNIVRYQTWLQSRNQKTSPEVMVEFQGYWKALEGRKQAG